VYTLANVANPMVWLAIAIVVLLLFGGQKIPEMMRGLGSGMREFKKGMSEEDDELRREQEDRAKKEAEIEREVRARVEEEMRRKGPQ
jgi:sec-independent protein translocase protein TatA